MIAERCWWFIPLDGVCSRSLHSNCMHSCSRADVLRLNCSRLSKLILYVPNETRACLPIVKRICHAVYGISQKKENEKKYKIVYAVIATYSRYYHFHACWIIVPRGATKTKTKSTQDWLMIDWLIHPFWYYGTACVEENLQYWRFSRTIKMEATLSRVIETKGEF